MQLKSVKMTMDWSKHKAGDVVKCNDADGCRMVSTGVANPHEYEESPADTPVGVQESDLPTAKPEDK